jgi:hypothetical protein
MPCSSTCDVITNEILSSNLPFKYVVNAAEDVKGKFLLKTEM